MNRTVTLDVLDRVQVASPCTADWSSMTGDQSVRHCDQCGLYIYNLSEMPRDEAIELVQRTEGRLCVRFYRRADGTMITRDCPTGLRALRRKAAAGLGRAAAAAAVVLGSIVSMGLGRPWWSLRLRSVQPFSTICEWINPTPPVVRTITPARTTTMTMGVMVGRVVPSPAPAPALSPSDQGHSR